MKNVLAALSIAGLNFASASALTGEDFTKYDNEAYGT
ncbi:calmodulin, partial [Pseudoalteromonas sp. S2755]